MRSIYLDHNATTPLAPQVQEAMLPLLAGQYGNPNSDHALGAAAAQAIDDARWRVARAIGAGVDEVYFTASASQSCRHAITRGVVPDSIADEPGWAMTTTLDHACVRDVVGGQNEPLIGCTADGLVDLNDMRAALAMSRPGSLLSVVHANNELGTIQPIAEFAEECTHHGVRLHTDAAQTFGKIPLRVDDLGVTYLSLTAHKAYGPKGVGALYVRSGAPVGRAYNNGVTLSAGTPDVAAIVGFGVAADLVEASLAESSSRLAALRDRLLSKLREGAGERLTVWGEAAERLPNTLCVSLPGVVAQELLRATPELCAAPCAVRTGGKITLSPALRAIGADEHAALGTVRLSVGWHNDEAEIDHAASLLLGAWERLRGEP
ncbi:Cysteine desulfurase [Pseudobythopirellula maris]|uniref:Cysteine desulfurase n=1 Tax=Pseudobythopirellula maris TaxID=2527991 RepID=A0A5C5ZLI3_9BACT|nr:aminotransferase class V-fold PLP-dependent enzyme [Pseudobythopirellula maris]TWT88314.1 Cysteine desulfurase [Pseudobythopirellula maris]